MSAPDAEFPAMVAEAVRAERAAAVGNLGPAPTFWLVAVPLWTLGAAEAAGFPVPSVIEFVKSAREVGWCQTRGSLRGQGEASLRFWIPDEVRRDVLDLLGGPAGPQSLILEAMTIAANIRHVLDGTDLDARNAFPPALADWATLITAVGKTDRRLVEAVRRAVEAQDLSGAQHLVAAGDTLAALLAGPVELAADRAHRLLSLGIRQRNDGRALQRYLDRPELSGAVARLLRQGAAAGDDWALHLRGVGGTGKTMLIRYLASGRYAADRGLAPIPVARADFDHMSPDYPVRRPVQLLLELADELALHTAAVGRADRALRRFRATAASVHESLSSLREERPSPMQNPQVLAAIDDFAAAVAELGEVLLILDTCEELAKADSGDPAAPAVTTTLAILERIHAGAPSVRVLFAGRRPLPARGYLRVREVTGFTVEEARRYLEAFSARPLPPALADAMIRQSPAVDMAIPATGELPGRVNPFDLALYRSWADEDPGLDVARVARGSDAYVEGRIIERLGDTHVRRALPILACAGRWRVQTIAAFTGGDPEVIGPRLAEQEWIDSAGDPLRHVAAQPALARKLWNYFSAPARAAAFAMQTERLAHALREQLRDAPLEDVDVDELLAVLRLSEPADAARLWDDFDARAVTGRRWSWLLNVTRRVLGESDEQQWPTAAALRATVTASFIAANRRAFALFNTRAAWNDVFEWAGCHPDATTGRYLRTRAALGLLPGAPGDEPLWEVLRTGLSPGAVSPEQHRALTAAGVDTVHRLLDTGADEAARQLLAEPVISGRLLTGPLGAADFDVQAWARVAAARLDADENLLSTRQLLASAELAVVSGTIKPAGAQVRPDWVPPDDLLARVRIEYGLMVQPDESRLRRWETYAADNPGTIDAERLASLCLLRRLENGVPERSVIERWEAADRYEPDRVATCSAHDLVPPLFATLARAWLAAGDPDRALAILDRRREAALDSRDDEATVRIADAETIAIARRLRLDDQRALIVRLAVPRYEDPARLTLEDSARRALAVVYGEWLHYPTRDVTQRPEGWHAWWQCVNNPQIATIPPPEWPSGSTSTESAADIEVDLEEMRLCERPEYRELTERLAAWLARPRPAPRVRSADRYRVMRTGMRRAALGGLGWRRWQDVPPRLIAEMAFEEAELLAPRLPHASSLLYEYALNAYQAGDDPIGAMLAVASMSAAGSYVSPATMSLVRARLAAERPDVAAALAGDPAQAGPWRYWANFVQHLEIEEYDRRPPWPVEVTGYVLDVGTQVFARLSAIAGLVGMVLLGVQTVPRYLAIGAVSLVGLLVAAAIATGTWRPRKVLRLADSQAVGEFGLPVLGFSALIQDQGEKGWLYLWAHLRPLATAPRRAWARIAVMAVIVALIAPLRTAASNGYSARLRPLHWETPRPHAPSQWWSEGTTVGDLHMTLADGLQPWERIITESLGPDAVGRIEWHRLVVAGIAKRRFDSHESERVALAAPDEWRRFIGTTYGSPQPEGTPQPDPVIQIQHAIGRAVSTSAGPRLDISGERAESASGRELIGVSELASRMPSLIVLQAEPVSEDDEARPGDDLPEKLQLAVDLAQTGTIRDILIVPAIPASLLPAVCLLIAEHAARYRGKVMRAPALQAALRQLIRPEVEPAVLDDLVLFECFRG